MTTTSLTPPPVVTPFRFENLPTNTKITVILCLLWICSPIDLLPDFLPIIGGLDDCGAGLLAVSQVMKAMSSAVRPSASN